MFFQRNKNQQLEFDCYPFQGILFAFVFSFLMICQVISLDEFFTIYTFHLFKITFHTVTIPFIFSHDEVKTIKTNTLNKFYIIIHLE